MFNLYLGKVDKIYYEITQDYDTPSERKLAVSGGARSETLEELALELAEKCVSHMPPGNEEVDITVAFYRNASSKEPLVTHGFIAQLGYSCSHLYD